MVPWPQTAFPNPIHFSLRNIISGHIRDKEKHHSEWPAQTHQQNNSEIDGETNTAFCIYEGQDLSTYKYNNSVTRKKADSFNLQINSKDDTQKIQTSLKPYFHKPFHLDKQ